MNDPKLIDIGIIASFSDGNCRQVLINPEMEELILNIISNSKNGIQVLDKIIDGVTIGKSKKV